MRWAEGKGLLSNPLLKVGDVFTLGPDTRLALPASEGLASR